MSYRPLARGIRAAVMNMTGGVQRHPTHFDFFARAPLDTRNAGPQAAIGALKHVRARDARTEILYLETVRNICVLERPVFDTHAFFLFVGSLYTRVTTLAQRSWWRSARGGPCLTKGSAIPACAVSNCEIAHTAARASGSQRGRKSPPTARARPTWGRWRRTCWRHTPRRSLRTKTASTASIMTRLTWT